jgi:hypothetical protein
MLKIIFQIMINLLISRLAIAIRESLKSHNSFLPFIKKLSPSVFFENMPKYSSVLLFISIVSTVTSFFII